MKRLIVILMAFAFVGCGVPEPEHKAKLAEIDKLQSELATAHEAGAQLQKDLDALRIESRTMADRLAELGDNVESLLGEKSALNKDLQQTREREAQLLAEQVAQRKRMEKYRQVIGKFQSLVSSGKLKIRIVRGQMVVEMASNILFPSGAADLHEDGQAALAELADVLRTIDGRDFQIAGHTDNVPISTRRFRSNWELSAARSVTVVRFLQDSGVNPIRLSAAGYGEFRPDQTNDSEDGKAANRRIEIVLMPNLDELPDMTEIEGEIAK